MIKKILIFVFLVFAFLIAFIFFQPKPREFSQNIKWGAAFSKPHAIDLGLNWQETYLAILDDLKVKYMRLPIYWPDVEPQENNYIFDDYDWMIREAEKRNVKLILAVGWKLPRWPECHEPQWVQSQTLNLKSQKLLDYVEIVVNRYKNSPALYLWQLENEPFFNFGECPDYDPVVLDKEIELVRSLDAKHRILTTDSGELGRWAKAVKRGDIFGTTMYRFVWNKYTGYVSYNFIFPYKTFWLRANLVRLFYPYKQIIVSELQAEPWKDKGMDIEKFQANIEFAEKVGFPEAYLWGAEWWYLLKVKQGESQFWDYAKKIYSLAN